MPRGRKPKNLIPEFIKNPPQHIIDYRNSPEGKVELEKQQELTRKTSNIWREMRRSAVTQEFLEMLDVTNPELMLAEEILNWEEAKLKYPDAIQKIKDATERNFNVQKRGAKSTHQKSIENYQNLINKFPYEFEQCISEKWSSKQTLDTIRNKMKEPWDTIWDGNKNGPSERTFRNIIKLAKAAHQKK